MTLSDEDVREILRLIDESPLDELRIETDGFSLHVRRGGGPVTAPGVAPAPDRASVAARGPAPAPDAPAVPEPPPPSPPDAGDALTVAAPMLGTFYRAEAPGQKPFVEVGDRIGADTTLCIIEVMKMMNSVPAGVAGTIVEVCAQNAELVEYGQPLFRVEPAA
jgi:acetyl-CoA carboxylase biotin carboxyl carrier protein